MANWLIAILQTVLIILAAPLLAGLIKICKCYLQNRKPPSLLQPYRDIQKLWRKQPLAAKNASWIFYFTPYLEFAIAVILCMLLPILTTQTLLPSSSDVILIVGLLGLSRFFSALAGMDVGTAFGGMGASREIFVAVLVEPGLMLALFTLATIATSTNLSVIISHINSHHLWLHPSLLLTGIGFALIIIAEAGRIPVDNPTTHLELTMLHEAMILEYGGRHLALIEWAKQIKLLFYFLLFAYFFLPPQLLPDLSGHCGWYILIGLSIKLLLMVFALGFLEVNLAKLRLFKVPLLLMFALMLILLGLFNYVMLEMA